MRIKLLSPKVADSQLQGIPNESGASGSVCQVCQLTQILLDHSTASGCYSGLQPGRRKRKQGVMRKTGVDG